jgi:uncharacterized phiE125 gp8 family phage protein
MTLKLITAPAEEPVTLAEAKVQCRVDADITIDDGLLTGLVVAAREACEHLIRRAIITQVWERTLDSFPYGGIDLGRPPVSAINSITFLDADGADQELATSAYMLDNASELEAWALPAAGTEWPDTGEYLNAVTVRFTCGFGAAAAVPQSIRSWILLKVKSLYDNCEMSPSADRLLDRWNAY